ncbi:hypothetical protein XarbCFBP7614_05625 [Xanthomonas arboricola]|nr:hypothetical protein XarbCFBP7614_05625 [Xanthomonas arboricola]
MPRKRLHGRTCGVSCDGRRARALQPSCSPAARQLIHPCRPTRQGSRTSGRSVVWTRSNTWALAKSK